MNKHMEGSDPEIPPKRGVKNHLLTSWAAIIALLGVGALPCPDCGMPMAWHLWPLAVLLLVGRWIARRKQVSPPGDRIPAPPDESGKFPGSD